MNRRRGFSLIEMLVIVAMTSVLLGLAVCCLHGLLRTEEMGQGRLLEGRRLADLSRAFRSDVHAAQRAEPTEGALDRASVVRFDRGREWRVEYRIRRDSIERNERRNGALIRRETWPMARGSAAHFVVPADEPHALVQAVVKRRGGDTHALEFRVEAMLGRDHRFEE